jgi:hypothetical protein
MKARRAILPLADFNSSRLDGPTLKYVAAKLYLLAIDLDDAGHQLTRRDLTSLRSLKRNDERRRLLYGIGKALQTGTITAAEAAAQIGADAAQAGAAMYRKATKTRKKRLGNGTKNPRPKLLHGPSNQE